MIRNWCFNYITLDGLSAESFEILPDDVEPPLELRRPTTPSGKKVLLKDIIEGRVAVTGDHRTYERRSHTWTSKTASYIEIDPRVPKAVADSSEFRKNNSNRRSLDARREY